jgi:hypothetical protein
VLVEGFIAIPACGTGIHIYHYFLSRAEISHVLKLARPQVNSVSPATNVFQHGIALKTNFFGYT